MRALRCADPHQRAAKALKRHSGKPVGEPDTQRGSVEREVPARPDGWPKFSATSDSERDVPGGEGKATEPVISASEPGSDEPEPPTVATRFEHYELATGEDGRPIELGRGGMGITYKAFDVELQCPVTLKVISERYLHDESARRRFLREARAAASLRHPNIASVFHLGKSGGNYFYAMEFVEGETLRHLIERRGRLEVRLALEITKQVAVGLAALHKKKLVHRDIKPANIMVSFEEEGAVTTKIIDLGLAKTDPEPGSQTAISNPGEFAGTPEFASPEQFAGVDVDIRSDLYSLGITLWQMLTGKTPFRGASAQVMYQHLHAPAPLDQLEGVPPTVVALLDSLVEKDPEQRFQSPGELLKAMPLIAGAIDKGSKIPPQSLPKMRATDSTRRRAARLGPKKISIARLPVTGSDLFGREEDIAILDGAWANRQVNVVTIVAWAGVGKSTLVNHWLRRMAAEHYRFAELVFGWSFYRQGTSEGTSSADQFLDAALAWFGDPDTRIGTAWEKGERLAKLVAHRRTLLILDGLEPLQNPPGPQEGRLREPSLQALLRELAAFNTGLCVIATRLPVADIADHEGTSALRRELEQLSSEAGAKLLRALGVEGHEAELRSASDEFRGHCLALTLLGSYLTDAYDGDIRRREEVSKRLAHDVRQGVYARKVMESYQTWFGEGPELSVLRLLGLFDRPADERALGAVLKPPAIGGLTESLTNLSATEWRKILAKLRRARLLAGEDPQNRGALDTHPLVREYYGGQLRSQQRDAWKECNRRLYHYYGTLAPQLPNSFREMHALALALYWAARLAVDERNPAEVERLASELIELSTRHNFVFWLATGEIYRGWARSVSGNTAEGIPWIEQGIRDFRATGAVLALPVWLAQKAEALHLADRTPEALEAINEAEALAERFEQRFCCAELHRLRGVFLAASGADEARIEASFCEAIRTAKEQKSISLAKRAEATYAEYSRQKATRSGRRGFRIPLS